MLIERLELVERAIKDLCQLSDADLFKEIAVGIGHVMDAVNELDSAIRKLHEVEHYYPARILESLATEEAAKVLILIDAVRCPQNRLKERSWTLSRFYDHLAKGIYSEACHWRPVDFAEVKRNIDRQRREYYLDGPNDVDWIFPNFITQQREDKLYVGYIREDAEEGQGGRYWASPSDFYKTGTVLGYLTPAVITLVRALHQVKATTPEGLSVIAEVWRPVDVCAEMSRGALMGLNLRTLEVLDERDLLAPAPTEIYQVICNSWIFPLWPLDLRVCKVERETVGGSLQADSDPYRGLTHPPALCRYDPVGLRCARPPYGFGGTRLSLP